MAPFSPHAATPVSYRLVARTSNRGLQKLKNAFIKCLSRFVPCVIELFLTVVAVHDMFCAVHFT